MANTTSKTPGPGVKHQPDPKHQHEGEGSRTGAKQYNDGATAFAHSGKVDKAAQDAARAVDGPEGASLRAAEAAGKSHSHGEDPALKKTAKH